MLKFALDGLWLLGSLVVVYALGVFTAQWAKDKIFGIPSEFRAALKALEAKTATAVADAKAKAIADAVKAISPAMPAVAKPVPAAPAAPAAPTG